MSLKTALIINLFLMTVAFPLSAQHWPQYRGPDATGNLAKTSLDLGQGNLKVHWKTTSPLGFSSFAIVGDKALTVVGRDEMEVCVALDTSNGKELWSYPMGSTNYGSGGGNAGAQGNKGGDGPRTTPAISDDRVFVYDAHLNLHCLSLDKGKLLWRQEIEKDFGGRNIKWKNATSPLVDESRVYVAGGGSNRSFLAFDKSTGDVIWKSGSETLTHASPAFAKMNGKQQVVFFVKSGLVAIDASNGKEVWRTDYPFNVSTAASPVVNGNQVYCSAGYGVGAGMFEISPSGDADEKWRTPNRLINHWSSPVLRDGYLYGLYKFKRYGKAPLQCVDFETGQVKWKHNGFGQGNCIVVGDKLIVLSDAGELAIIAAKPDGYQELWRDKVLDGKCWSTPAFADGKIFIRSTKEAACVSFE